MWKELLDPTLRREHVIVARRVRHAGLFGQTWLACEVEGPRVEDERAEQWCVTLVNSLDTAS